VFKTCSVTHCGVTSFLIVFIAFFSCPLFAETAPPLGVRVQTAEALWFYPEREAMASVEALNVSRIPARISSVIDAIKVRVGDSVKAGQTLALLDCRQNRLYAKQQQALLEQLTYKWRSAEREYQRRQTLMTRQSVSQAELDRTLSDYKQQHASLAAQQALVEQAQLQVEFCTIQAPFTGVVSERVASEGEPVTPGQPVIALVETHTLEIRATVPVAESADFAAAATWAFVTPQQRHALKLRAMLPVVAQQSRSREARLLPIDSPHDAAGVLIPGLAGRVVWQSRTPHLPANLLQQREGQLGVFIVETREGATYARFLALPDAREGQPVSVAWSGTTRVITEGRLALRDGQLIDVMP